ncbi:tetratricopeptide repeat protein [uncultured Thermanaerothrix sp.]|uniref:tetratricopeptide repeat protein n=1 Tax=uncultured Thermanaerothrix sp. TaxID=1195149 RepID=UPI0026028704|nr:tetratricopeptide repeat protein [uncultured Thermanaerothrix sp.]
MTSGRPSLNWWKATWLRRAWKRYASWIEEGIYFFLFLVTLWLNLWPRPWAADTLVMEGRLARLHEDKPQALTLWLRAAEYLPDYPKIWRGIASLAYEAADYPTVIRALEQLSAYESLLPMEQRNLAEAYFQTGDLAAAADIWLALMRDAHVSSPERVELVTHLRRINLDLARQAVRVWLEQFPDDPKALQLAILLFASRDPALALDCFQKVSTISGQSHSVYQALGEALTSAAHQPGDVAALMRVGQVLGQSSEWDLAREAFEQVVVQAPEYAEGWVLLSEARQQLGQSGLEELEMAYRLAPDAAAVRAAWGLYWRRAGQPERALPFYQALARQFPEDPRWQMEMAETYAAMGDVALAVNYYDWAVALAPQDALVWRYYARFALAYGLDLETYALPAARKALELEPDDPETLDLMGWITFLNGDVVQGERFLQQALIKDTHYMPALLHQAQIWLWQREWESAHEALLQVVSQSNNSELVLQAQRLLEQYFPQR